MARVIFEFRLCVEGWATNHGDRESQKRPTEKILTADCSDEHRWGKHGETKAHFKEDREGNEDRISNLF